MKQTTHQQTTQLRISYATFVRMPWVRLGVDCVSAPPADWEKLSD